MDVCHHSGCIGVYLSFDVAMKIKFEGFAGDEHEIPVDNVASIFPRDFNTIGITLKDGSYYIAFGNIKIVD